MRRYSGQPGYSQVFTRHEVADLAYNLDISLLSAVPLPRSVSKRKLQVFLCYASEDKVEVRALAGRLKMAGIEIWLDEESLLPGHDWQLEISRAVKESDAVVVLLSQSTIDKTGYVQKEIKLALDRADEQPEGSIFLIPAKLEECAVPERLAK